MDNNQVKESPLPSGERVRERGISLGKIEKIPVGQGLCFVVEGEEIAVFRPRTGGLFAVQNRCPHRQGPLCEGVVGAHQVVCPYHAHKFDLRSGEGSESGETVKVYSVFEKEGEVFLDKQT